MLDHDSSHRASRKPHVAHIDLPYLQVDCHGGQELLCARLHVLSNGNPVHNSGRPQDRLIRASCVCYRSRNCPCLLQSCSYGNTNTSRISSVRGFAQGFTQNSGFPTACGVLRGGGFSVAPERKHKKKKRKKLAREHTVCQTLSGVSPFCAERLHSGYTAGVQRVYREHTAGIQRVYSGDGCAHKCTVHACKVSVNGREFVTSPPPILIDLID